MSWVGIWTPFNHLIGGGDMYQTSKSNMMNMELLIGPAEMWLENTHLVKSTVNLFLEDHQIKPQIPCYLFCAVVMSKTLSLGLKYIISLEKIGGAFQKMWISDLIPTGPISDSISIILLLGCE